VFGLPNVAAYAIGSVLAVAALLRASFSLSILAMLAASPALHVHYWTWLLVPFFAIWIPWVIARLNGRSAAPENGRQRESRRSPAGPPASEASSGA
jgi:hypothetical protein